MHVFVACQYGVLNKQLVSLLSSFTTSLSESYILTINRYLDAKKNTSRILKQFITYFHVENNLLYVYTQFFNSIFKGTFEPIYLPLQKNNALKKLQFNSSQKKLAFYKIFFLWDISPVNGLKTFYIGIEINECFKKQTMFQRNMEDSKGK